MQYARLVADLHSLSQKQRAVNGSAAGFLTLGKPAWYALNHRA
jgi:hypothetical protein